VPAVVTIPVAVQPVPPALGAELVIAPFAPEPCVTVAPPPSSFVPAPQVAVDAEVRVFTTGLPPLLPVVPVTTVVLPTTPAGPAAPVSPLTPWMPWMPWSPLAPAVPVSPLAPVEPVSPLAPSGP
jgi:hypothetical protein